MITDPVTTTIIENVRKGTNLLSSSLLSGSQTGSRVMMQAQALPGTVPGEVIPPPIDSPAPAPPTTSPASDFMTVDDLVKQEKLKILFFVVLSVYIIFKMRF